MVFDALLAVSIVLSLLALFRMRPSLFMVAINQVVVLRAMSNIERYGQPESQAYVPSSVFSTENIEIAKALFAIATFVLAIGICAPERKRSQQELPALPSWLTLFLGLYFLMVAISTRTILTHGYTDPGRIIFNVNLSGIHELLVGLMLYEVYRRVVIGSLQPLLALALLFLMFSATDYLKGSTGFATGTLIGAAILFFRQEARSWRRWGQLAGTLLLLVATAVVVRGVRSEFHTEGQQAVEEMVRDAAQGEEDVARNGEGIEGRANGSQYAAHVLECISLYESGIRRDWRSIYLPLEYTFKPSILVNMLGWERSEEAAWELSRYYIHGGGTYLLGELYWNGGYLCVWLVFAGLVWVLFLSDTRAPNSLFWCALVCVIDVGLFQGIGYGFAQTSRGAINGVIAFFIIKAIGTKATKDAGLESYRHSNGAMTKS